jgi:GNAT superfamily N-acetyltransferase
VSAQTNGQGSNGAAMTVDIRPMRMGDLRRVSELSEQLGYPVSSDLLENRFSRLVDSPVHALFVAESEGRVVGWIHAHPQILLEAEPYAEIGGLVVDTNARRMGIGRALVLKVKHWANDCGLERVRVRSDIRRQEAHQFYPSLGFTWLKTQHNYELQVI